MRCAREAAGRARASARRAPRRCARRASSLSRRGRRPRSPARRSSPESAVASTISKSVTPVRASPVRIAHGIGARPRWRGSSVGCMPKTPSPYASWMNGVADELRPADDEDRLGSQRRAIGVKGLLGVDVTGLVEDGPETGCDLVERALPRAIGIDRPGQRDDSHDLRTHVGSRLEAVAADRVEAHPDRAHRRAMV